MHGIEINEYARELAQATIWIGYIQWFIRRGYGFPDEPILKPIDSIEHRDAILNPDGTEPEWPADLSDDDTLARLLALNLAREALGARREASLGA